VIPESQLVCNFYDGLGKRSARHLDFGKPFLQRDSAVCIAMLESRVGYDTSRHYEEESESSHENPSTALFEHSTSTPQDLSVEVSPEPRTRNGEQI
jgi:hypothetical protein